MITPLGIIAILVCIYSVVTHNHRLNVFISILSVVCDTLYINIGGLNFLLIYFVGYLNLPLILNSGILKNGSVNSIIKYIRNEYIYLILLGIIFGFIFPWQDTSGTRMWNQTAQGRALVSLLRIFSEFIVLLYFAYVIINKRVSIRYIVYAFAIASAISFWVGFMDYLMGYPIKSHLFNLTHFEAKRFLGLNGEPKALGRAGALSYAFILIYKLTFTDKSKFLTFALLTNVFAVILSSSASSYILFILLNLAVFFNFSVRNIGFSLALAIVLFFTYNTFYEKGYLHEDTNQKVQKALFAIDDEWVVNEPEVFKRFDIWDRLALIYLWKHPAYFITGVGPNLISIPMSEYIPRQSVFYTLGRVDSVPNVMLINILSRSGLIGLILISMGLISIYNYSRKNLPEFFMRMLVIAVVFSMVYFNIVFYLTIGIITGYIYLSKQEIDIEGNN